jgi:hypothetical protein
MALLFREQSAGIQRENPGVFGRLQKFMWSKLRMRLREGFYIIVVYSLLFMAARMAGNSIFISMFSAFGMVSFLGLIIALWVGPPDGRDRYR